MIYLKTMISIETMGITGMKVIIAMTITMQAEIQNTTYANISLAPIC
jgi:hypothetical protein